MARRRLLMPDRWSALLSAPTDEENLIRYYTLSADDLDRTLGKRGERNQLGFAVQLCLMRHPGRLLGQGEAVPARVLTFIADQLGVNAAVFPDYGRRDNTRREHAAELQQRLGLRTMTREDQRAALVAAINAATPTDKGEPIAAAVMEAFRKRQVLLPSANRIDRIGTAGRAFARKRAQTVLLEGYSAEQLSAFENLLTVDPTIKQTRFGWLRSHPEAPGDKNLLGLIERLEFVRSLPLDPTRRQRIHPDRWRQMVREGEITPSWLAADFNANRRRATIVAQLIELAAQLSDAAIGMFNKQIGRLFTTARAKAEQRHLDTRKETAKALRLFRDTLRALAEAKESGEDALDVVDERVGWHRLLLTQPTLEAMVETADPAPLLIAAERYVGLRRYAPQFLDAFTFRSNRANDPLVAAIGLLRGMNLQGKRTLPDKVPVAFLTRDARTLIFAGGKPDRRLYETATLAALRDRLRSGDIWVEGCREFRPFDEHLMAPPAFAVLKNGDRLQLGVPADADAYLEEARRELDLDLKRLADRARGGKLDGVRLADGELTVTPLRADVPAEVDDLKRLLNQLLPRVDITDLLAEVHAWTGFADQFTHLRTQDSVRSIPAILAALLADATNLGPKRMADASAGVTERQITWARLFHIRPETYKAAQAVVINAHAAHPYAKVWGGGTTSSSDGQFFRAGDRGARRSDVNTKYGNDPGVMFYTHVSDQYGHFHILPISPTESEAPYVLDGLYNHDTKLRLDEHFVDTGGATDHVFGLFALLGKRFAPRLRDLKSWRMYTFASPDSYPDLKRHIAGQSETQPLRDNWDELLRLAASLSSQIVAPSVMLKKLAASPKQNQLSRALRALGRIERTRFMIEWYSNPALRRRCQIGLNKGEAGHKLKRAVFFHERGEVRDRAFEDQAFRASGLNLVVSAIVYWNTVYLARAVNTLRAQGRDLPDQLLRHVSPQTWEHINLTGIYSWANEMPLPDTFRPLREDAPASNAAA